MTNTIFNIIARPIEDTDAVDDESDDKEGADDIGLDGTVMSNEDYFDDYSEIECEVS